MRILLLLLLISTEFFSQDTIRLNNGEIKVVKINEVGIENIKYHNFNNIEGPVYIVPKNEVRTIRYSSGLVEVYRKTSAPVYQVPTEKKEVVEKAAPLKDTNFYKIDILSDQLIYKNRPMSEKRLRDLVYEYPNKTTGSQLILETDKIKKYKKRQVGFLIGGLGIAAGFLYGGLEVLFITTVGGDGPPESLAPIVLGGALIFGVSGPLISRHFKNKRVKTKLKIAKLYNEGR